MNKAQARVAKFKTAEENLMDVQRRVYKGDVWRHLRSGRSYSIIGTGLIEKTLDPAVMYKTAMGHGPIFIRPADEFLDGRFIRQDDDN